MNFANRLDDISRQSKKVEVKIQRLAFLSQSCMFFSRSTKSTPTEACLRTCKSGIYLQPPLRQHSANYLSTIAIPLVSSPVRLFHSISLSSSSSSSSSIREEHEHAPEHYGFIHVATVTGAHGVYGAVKVTSVSDFAEHRLSGSNPSTRFLKLRHRRYPRPVGIKFAKKTSHIDVWIVHFDEMTSREEFKDMQLQGAKIYVRGDEDRPPLARGEYVVSDLIDMRVALKLNEGEDDSECSYRTKTRSRGEIAAGKVIGIVEDIVGRSDICQDQKAASIANDVLQIALFQDEQLDMEVKFSAEVPEEATRVLVPFVPQLVPIVDLSVSLIVVDPPAGLFDIAIVKNATRPKAPRGLLMPAKS